MTVSPFLLHQHYPTRSMLQLSPMLYNSDAQLLLYVMCITSNHCVCSYLWQTLACRHRYEDAHVCVSNASGRSASRSATGSQFLRAMETRTGAGGVQPKSTASVPSTAPLVSTARSTKPSTSQSRPAALVLYYSHCLLQLVSLIIRCHRVCVYVCVCVCVLFCTVFVSVLLHVSPGYSPYVSCVNSCMHR
jgi:hypothetical protein